MANTEPTKESVKHRELLPIVEFKEDSDSLIVKGFIATTHFDGQDRLTKEALELWAKEINEGIPRVNKASVNHDRIPHVAGVGIKGTAKVLQLPDKEWGLYVETKIDKTREDYADILYRVKEGFLDSFSIEYVAPEDATVDHTGTRILDVRTQLFGWTLASQPMNEHAVMIKEFMKSQSASNVATQPIQPAAEITPISSKEENTMVDTKEVPASQPQETKEQVKPTEVKEAKPEMKEEEVVKNVLESKEFKEKVDKMVADKPKLNKETENMKIEVKEYHEIFSKDSKLSVKEQFARAGRLADSLGLTMGSIKHTTPAEGRSYKNFTTNGSRMEYKGLSIGSNINAAYIDDTSGVGIAQAELQDVFDPVIYNALNEQTVLWNVLAKDNKANSGSNRVEFVLKTAANTSAGAYLGNAIGTGSTTREKYVTKFKKYKADFAIDGDMIAAARGGPIGDILSQEIADATLALLSSINADLFKEYGLETAAQIIGLEFVSDSAGNTTMYSTTRSSANKLAPASAGDTYIDGSGGNYKALLRQAIRQITKDGGQFSDILIVCDPIQVDKIKETFDNSQRNIGPTATRFGFETAVFFEGAPVLADKDSNDDDIWVIDTRAHRAAIFVPPTVEMLGKRSDAEEGFIKTYFAIYNTAPRRLVQIYGCPTS